mmetsp:Transcript_5508/g.4700  ORF Transcript_5508/g.4700 Transcript_5508/m.4700 type:complete len:80 (+) Transcript_5508:246-485(+)
MKKSLIHNRDNTKKKINKNKKLRFSEVEDHQIIKSEPCSKIMETEPEPNTPPKKANIMDLVNLYQHQMNTEYILKLGSF